MNTKKITEKVSSGINNGRNKLRNTLLVLATSGMLAGSLSSCDNDHKYGKGTTIKQSEVKGMQEQFETEFQNFMRKNDIIDSTNNHGNNINLGPILIERGINYSILLSTSGPVGQKSINKMYDNGTIEYSYYIDGMGGFIAGVNTPKGWEEVNSSDELKKIYEQVIPLFKKANSKK